MGCTSPGIPAIGGEKYGLSEDQKTDRLGSLVGNYRYGTPEGEDHKVLFTPLNVLPQSADQEQPLIDAVAAKVFP